MKKYLWIIVSLALMLTVLVACGESEAPPAETPPQEAAEAAPEPTEAPPPATEEPAEEIVQEPEEETQEQEEPVLKTSSGVTIPAECFADEDALYDCWDEGLIPDECIAIDDDGYEYVIEECMASEADSSDSSAAEEAAPASNPTIPTECLESEDAFDQCWDEGLIPLECLDNDGYIIEACFGEAEAAQGGDEVAAAPNNNDAPGSGSNDSGFRPEVDGFNFENYGGESDVINLTTAELQRMFGDQVCANMADGCTLTPPARQWMEQMNEGMSGGHCEGMAVLSSLMYYDHISPNDFGGNVVYDLSLSGNTPLQQEIAYWFVTQGTWPGGFDKVNESPNAVVDTLTETFNQGKTANEWWALGIYKPDFSGGHAVTPFAVEDQGNGITHIFVYDNNYPGRNRVIEVNRDANTWSYEASPNPSIEADLYEGNAETQTLEVVAISPRLQMQEGDFAHLLEENRTIGLASPLLQGQDVVEVWLDGDADLLITTETGERIGWLEDGSFVNEINGAQSTNLKFGIAVWDINEEPVYLIPTEVEFFTITVDGSRLEEASPAEVTLIGPGYTLVVEELWLDPGEFDEIEVSTLGSQYYGLTYISDYSDSPDIVMGIETDEADYEFVVRGTEIEAGGAFNVELDYPNGDFILNTSEQEEYGVYQLLVLRIDDDGEYVFGNDELILEPDDTMYLNFLEWEGEGSSMYLDFDYESDDTIDETIELEDEEDFYEDFYQDWE